MTDTVTIPRAEFEEIKKAFLYLPWKSADRDNMEYACKVTCYQWDKIWAAMLLIEKHGAK